MSSSSVFVRLGLPARLVIAAALASIIWIIVVSVAG
jgi:hypothetical protein